MTRSVKTSKPASDPFAGLKDGLPRRTPGEAPALYARHVSKIFGTTKVLDDVTLAVMPGEVHGLLGANGSGKSTFIKTIAGLHDPEPGADLILYGEGAPLPMPAGSARRLGISFVHQHLALMPSLTVLENMLLNDLAVEQNWNIRWGTARRQVAETFERFDIHIDPMTRVADLPQADRALIAICRAFEEVRVNAGAGRGILILDEPTPFLPKSGVDQLFSLIRGVVADGASVILVAHDIDEIREITDRATILRDGKLAGTVTSSEASQEDFIELIVGEKVTMFQSARTLAADKPVTASVRRLNAEVARDVSFDIREGEIRAIIGPNGAGKSSMLNVISGFYVPQEGEVWFRGARRPQMKPYQVAEQGIARTFQNIALFDGMSVLDNIMTGRLTMMKSGLLSQALWWGRAERNNISYASYLELANHPQVLDMIQSHVEEVNVSVAADEMLSGCQIHRFLVLHKELDADDGEMTRTRKVKRGVISDKFADLVDALYAGKTEQYTETEVTYEDGRKGKIRATLQIRDAKVQGETNMGIAAE